MQTGFWKTIKKPIMVLAPMADVTDAAFRRVIAKYGKPDVFWTEFVSCDGLCSPGKQKLLPHLWYTPEERPIIAQFFTSKPDNMRECAKLAKELGFDGVDINMGCPDKNVEKQGAGAALIKNPSLAQELIAAAKEGAGEVPVSIKTRIGYNTNEIETWLPTLLETKPAAITIHARTRKEMSDVPARWDVVVRAVEIRNEFDGSSNHTLILGNGDVETLNQAYQKVEETGVDGVMIGRGIFGNPWLFNQTLKGNGYTPTLQEKLRVMLEHTKLFEELFGNTKNFDVMKKHYKAYVNGFPGASELRVKLMQTKTASQVEAVLQESGLLK